MKVLYDYQIFNMQLHGGVSRYYYELINRLSQQAGIDVEVSVSYSDNQYLSHTDFLKPKVLWRHLRGEARNSVSRILNRQKTRAVLRRQDFDVFHPTYYRPYFLHDLGHKPFVLTIYDMTHELFAREFPVRQQTVSRYKKLLAQRATKIIAISENTKRDVIEIFKIPDTKIEVIHLANSISEPSTVDANINLPKKYLLFVGKRGGYKNFEFFVKSVVQLMFSDGALNIVCVGGGALSVSENQLLAALKIRHKVFHYSLRDEILSTVYRHAIAFVFPSLYEGFGLPILEAFSCMCPTIVSNTSSFPEVAGDAAVYFDPKSECSIQEAIECVLRCDDLRTELAMRGREQLKKFSWETTAEKTKKLYEYVLGN